MGAVEKGAGPDLGVVDRRDPHRRLAEGVLIDIQNVVVGEKGFREGVQTGQVAADQQRRREQAPERNMQNLLVGLQVCGMGIAESNNADHQHIGVVPMARASEFLMAVLRRKDAAQAAPVVVNIAGGAPAVTADARAPGPDIRHAVLAQAVEDIPVGGLEGLSHQAVRLHLPLQTFARSDVAIGAPVVFQVVDAPGGVGGGILTLMLPACSKIGAGFRARGGVDPDLQSFAMHIVGQ